jgi:hypothetical protein
MRFDAEELSRRARGTADAHRSVARALRDRAEADGRIAQAFIELANAERQEADVDPNPQSAEVRRYQAGLSEQHAGAVQADITTTGREADAEQSYAEAADGRAVAPGSNVFQGPTTRECKVELGDDLVDRPVAIQRHPEHEPDDLFRWQPAPPQRGRSGRLQRLLDLVRIDARLHPVEGALDEPVLSDDPPRETTTRHGTALRAFPAS